MLSFHSFLDSTGQVRYCYIDDDGNQAPTLRVRPGDLVVLKLKNDVAPHVAPQSLHREPRTNSKPAPSAADCAPSLMAMDATNLHFHGLGIPPTCHQDESLHTQVRPSDRAFEYRFRIPKNQPPGLYWYHPHLHGHTEEQVLGGASGAMIVEGIEKSNRMLRNLPERVFVIRDQKLPGPAPVPRDIGRPAKDLSINFVPVPYPEYPAGTIQTRPSQREFWRVLNASADTYLDLAVLFNGKREKLGLVAVDGSSVDSAQDTTDSVIWQSDIPIPPGGRAEFIFNTPGDHVRGELLTFGVDTAPQTDEDDPAAAGPNVVPQNGVTAPDDDDYTPPRPLAKIVSLSDAPQPETLPASGAASAPVRSARHLSQLRPVRQREFYFSEEVRDPQHPIASTVFYITEKGQKPSAFDPAAAPNIIVHTGDIEDWIIENRSQESHDFHIHQLHFLLLERDGAAAPEPYLRDTVDVPYWDGVSPQYPSVKLRMDFRDPNIVGAIPYHCHIMQHSDGGMMGVVEVKPSPGKRPARTENPPSAAKGLR